MNPPCLPLRWLRRSYENCQFLLCQSTGSSWNFLKRLGQLGWSRWLYGNQVFLYKNWEILPLTKSVSNYYHELICTFLERICLFNWKTKIKKKQPWEIQRNFRKLRIMREKRCYIRLKPLEVIFKLKFSMTFFYTRNIFGKFFVTKKPKSCHQDFVCKQIHHSGTRLLFNNGNWCRLTNLSLMKIILLHSKHGKLMRGHDSWRGAT